MHENPKKVVAMVLFFLSGMLSLIFQVVWLKMLLPVFGSTVWAVSTLLTAFMAGLALGSLYFGRVADRTSSPLRLYGILEGFIGAYGLATLFIFKYLYHVYVPLYALSGGDNLGMGLIKFLLGLLVLLPPTICMGATLPLLARRFTVSLKSVGGYIGSLYTLNTLGAVFGTFLAGFYLLPQFGLHQTVLMTALGNFVILLLSFFMTRKEKIAFKLKGIFQIEKKQVRQRWVLVLYFVCGFTALSHEVIWNRLLSLHIGSSVYAYTAMLVVYLLGLTLGAGIMTYYLERITNPVRVLAGVQFLLALVVIMLINQFGNLYKTMEALSNVMTGSSYLSYTWYLLTVTGQLILLPTVLFGACFPLVVRLFVSKKADVGTETGALYAANTLGTIFGSFGAGFLMLPFLGAQKGLLLIASLNLGVAVYLEFKGRGPLLKKIIMAVTGIAVFYLGYFLLTSENQVILKAGVFQDGDRTSVKLLSLDEDIYATVAVEERHEVRGSWLQLSMNGVNVAGTSCELFAIQKLQGHLPMLLHKNPQRVLHIGFGSGGTAWAVSRYPVEKITIAEISRSVILKASKYFSMVNHGVLRDPRVEVVFTDGRNRVLADPDTYDVILSDSIHPRFSGNGSLYTYDYYQLLKKRLKPGGVVSQWLPFYSITPQNLKMIIQSFYKVFPNTSIWFANSTLNAYVIVIGRLDSGKIDYAEMERKLALPAVAKDLKEIDSATTYKLLDFFLFADDKVGEFVYNAPLHTDDNMAVEFFSGRSLSKSITSYMNFMGLLKFRESVVPYLVNLEQATESKEKILQKMHLYETATTFNMLGQGFFWEGKRQEAFEKFDQVAVINPEDKEPVEYFGASYQKAFLKQAAIILN